VNFVPGEVRVSVPATTANLGPGYDSLALALAWRDELVAEVIDSGLRIEVTGPYADAVPRDASHLVFRAMARGFEALGVPTPGLHLRCATSVPHGRGLGSSAAAIVGGLALARSLVPEGATRLADAEVFRIAADMEGHPDNVAAALFGGLVISGERTPEETGASRAEPHFFAHRAAVHPDVGAAVFVPDFAVATTVARSLLPAEVPHSDAAANAGRAALLVAGLGTAPWMLFTATRDFLHQDYREPAMPQTLGLVRELRSAGFAATVSGAGPTVLVLGSRAQTQESLTRCPRGWDARVLDVDPDGVLTS
jgi:homoserine kinase